MKKVVKFICLLIVAALIAILIIRNGAKADGDVTVEGPGGGITVGSNLSVTITFPYEVTSYSGGKVTATYVDGGETIESNGIENLDGPTIKTLDITLNEPFEKSGKVIVTVDFDQITYKDIEAPSNCNNVTCEVVVKDKETTFELKIGKNKIEVGEETHLTVNPPIDDIVYTTEPEGVVSISTDGTVKAEKIGTTTITATSKDVMQSIDVEVIEKSEPDPGTNPDPGTDPNPETTPGVKRISIGKATIKVNETTKVSATVVPSDAVVTYSSSDATVATVDASGTVTGKSAGSADITAEITVDGNTYNDKVTITVDKEDDEEPTPTPTPTVEGETPKISVSEVTLEAYYKETIVKSNIPVTWKSSDSNIAAVERINDLEARIVSANKAGNCEIIATANAGGKTASVKVTVVKPKNEDTRNPVLSPSTDFQLAEGASITMVADVDVTWSSDNASVATVDKNNGVVTAKAAGTAKITATSKSNGKVSTVNVTVKALGNSGGSDNDGGSDNNDSNTKAFTLTPSKAQTLKVGETLQLKASDAVASWQSSKKNVASVDKNGKVTAIGAGTAYISAVSIDSTVAQIKVTVKEDGSVSQNTTGNVASSNSSSQVNKEVPATGESTTERLIVLAVITLVISVFIFRKKTK